MVKAQAFKLKGRLYTFTVLQLLTVDRELFAKQLAEVTQKAPKLFDNTPVVLDCSALKESEFDLEGFFQHLRALRILPVAIQGASPWLAMLAQTKGVAVLHASDTQDKFLIEEEEPLLQASNKMLTTPVRSGQQVVAKGGDLTITAPVSHGAELLADGNIHVYGVLRGRALAGISGNKNARIFCHSLDAELVSIAGFYRLSDAIEPVDKPCQIFLADDHICIEPI